MCFHHLLIYKGRGKGILAVLVLLLQVLAVSPLAQARSPASDLESSYRFLVSDRGAAGGILYRATAGKLQGRRLPLSFADSAEYWGAYVCSLPGNTCPVTDSYDPRTFTLTPEKTPAGELQTERVNIHNGANIYDAATWQIAVMLGQVLNGFSLPDRQDAYALVSNQNVLLKEGYNGNSVHAQAGENRAMTAGKVFVYNNLTVTDPRRAYTFRMLPRKWLASDPFIGSPYADQVKTSGLPLQNPDYQLGTVTWTDWKPVTGENAWAFLLGPLQAAYIHYVIGLKSASVPLADPAVQNALDLLPTFAAMQSPSGAVYYAPAGTVMNRGDRLVDPYEVAVENNLSLYAGLRILDATLRAILRQEKNLGAKDREAITGALQLGDAMINGGVISNTRSTSGLLSFFKNEAWHDGGFVQGGRADDPGSAVAWLPNLEVKAVDVNTWGITALGPGRIDAWFGPGAAYRNWRQIKQWGGYGVGKSLWGVGFSDQDGNGVDAVGNYRQGILSTEWTAGAITMLRSMIAYYQTIPAASPQYREARGYLATLNLDEQSMLAGLEKMRVDTYATADFPGRPPDYPHLLPLGPTRPFLYASKRYLIPFGWYANPIPSTCATAWTIMVAAGYNPFAYGGKY